MLKKYRKLIYVLLIAVFLVCFWFWQNDSLQVTRFIINYENLPQEFDGYRIVQISDMHGKYFGRNNKRLVDRISSLKPDILFVTGDMMTSNKYDGQAFIDFLEEFGQQCPVYMCLGNHEQIAGMIVGDEYYTSFIKSIQEHGVILLDNEKTTLKKKDESITISGLTLALFRYSRRDKEYYDEALFLTEADIDLSIGEAEEGFNIMLAHNPVYFSEYASWGADLVLSGHVHGGIIQVPFKGGLLSPEHVFFPEYDAGLYEIEDSIMIVNRGLGSSGVNFRLFNRPDITFIELRR